MSIAFDAKWLVPYFEEDIYEDGEFHNADGTMAIVPFMSSTEYYYIEDDYFTGFIKHYKGGRYALMTLLPKKENDKMCLELKVNAEMPEFFPG